MQTFLGYWLIQPIAVHYIDRFDSVPDLTYSYSNTACGTIELAVFLKAPAKYIRVTVKNYSPTGESVSEKDDEIFKVVNSAEPIIRLCYNGEAKFYDHVLVTFYEANEQHIFEIKPAEIDSYLPVKGEEFKVGMDSVMGSDSTAIIYRLFVDSHDESIPLQYRYLSLYKIIELALKVGDQWDHSALGRCIASCGIESTKPEGVTRSVKNWIHELRDKCAHIKNGRSFGVTGLDTYSARQISSALPLMNRLACAAIGPLASELQLLTAGVRLRYSIVDKISGRTLKAGG